MLGPLHVSVDGRPVRLGGPMPRALLLRLVIAAGETVPGELLIDELWQGSPPASAASTLHSYVSTLRRVLEPAHGAGEPQVLVRRGTGYALVRSQVEVDADRFTVLARQGRAALDENRSAEALALLTEALGGWSGEAYADAAGRMFAAAAAAGLDAQRAVAHEDRLAALLAVGRHDEAVAELEALTRREPLRERAWELLARAHYAAGRQGDALDALRRVREVLAAELGADPGAALTELQRQILAQDAALAPAPPAARPSRATRHVPAQITSFLGRTDDLTALAGLLEAHRLVTVTGPGGIGKTRLARELAAARNDPDGPWFVEFAGLGEGEALQEAVVRVLGLAAPGGLDTLTALLRDRRLLLVLDNCEHVAAAAAELCAAVLAHCPGVSILATSRARLGIAGERTYALAPLAAGADLFYERAALAPCPEERADVEALCAALDNLPLAIELAAARTTVLSVAQLREMLGQRFALLADSARAADPAGARHASMQAAIDGSYQALGESERQLFAALSVFSGGFDLAAAEEVTGHRPLLLIDLATLVDRSMVTVLGGDPRRYRVLETLREYGRDRLTPQRAAQLTQAHTAWVRAVAARAHENMRGPHSHAWTKKLDAEMPNVHAALGALRESDWTGYLELTGHLYWFWYRRGYVDEGLRALAPIAGVDLATDPSPIRDRVQATVGRCLLSYLAGDLPVLFDSLQRLETLLAEAVFDDDALADRRARADAAVTLGFFQSGAGAVDIGRERARLGARLAAADDYAPTYAETQMALGMAAFRAGEHDEARDLLAHAVDAGAACGYDWLVASALWISAKNDIATGEIGTATQDKLRRMLDACERVFDLTSWMVGVLTAAYLLFLRGDRGHAAQLVGVVRLRSDLTGFDPERMDLIELAAYAAEMRETSDPDEWNDGVCAGTALSRDQVAALLDLVLPAPSRA